jgi:hypothetical protein
MPMSSLQLPEQQSASLAQWPRKSLQQAPPEQRPLQHSPCVAQVSWVILQHLPPKHLVTQHSLSVVQLAPAARAQNDC